MTSYRVLVRDGDCITLSPLTAGAATSGIALASAAVAYCADTAIEGWWRHAVMARNNAAGQLQQSKVLPFLMPSETGEVDKPGYARLRAAIRDMEALGEDHMHGVTVDAAAAAVAVSRLLEAYRTPLPKIFSLDREDIVFVWAAPEGRKYLSGAIPEMNIRYYDTNGRALTSLDFDIDDHEGLSSFLSHVGGTLRGGVNERVDQHYTLRSLHVLPEVVSRGRTFSGAASSVSVKEQITGVELRPIGSKHRNAWIAR